MQRLILLMIVVATTFDFLARGDSWERFAVLPREAKFVGELLGAIAVVAVAAVGARSRFQFVRPAYWLAFAALLFIVVCGVIVNDVDVGPIFAGIRGYCRAIPWFFVAAVYAFTEPEVKKQLHLLLVVSLLQVPLAIEQRIRTMYFGKGSSATLNFSGDFTTGTFANSATLSIFMMSGMCLLVALLVRKKVSMARFAILFPVLLVPTLINETKATVFLLPLGLMVAFIAAAMPGRRLRAFINGSALVLVVGMVFVPVYNQFRSESQPGILEFLMDPEVAEEYLWKKEEIGTAREKPAGRIDSIVVPLRHLSEDPAHLAFGFGVGNATDSALGSAFVGRYADVFAPFMTTAFARIVLELGVLGLSLVLALMWMIYRDCRVVANLDDGILGALGAALAGITAVMVVTLVYRDLTNQMSMSFLFWFYAGLVSAHRMRASIAMRQHERTVEGSLVGGR